MIKKYKQTGDTIVEVLIAVAIVSLILAISYSIANHNVRVVQDAQEHSQALQLAQRQLEFLRVQGSIPSGNCFSSAGAVVSGASCNVDASDTPTLNPPVYKIKLLTPGPSCTAAAGYCVQVQWDSLLNGETAQVTLVYGP